MKSRYATSSRPRAKGFTLIEAIVGSLIMGSLLVAILLAMSNLNVQGRRTQDAIQASVVLDELMEQWWQDRPRLPRDQSGSVPGHADWRWRTKTIERVDAQSLKGVVLAVEVFAPQQADRRPAARVEILLPPEEEPAQ